METIPSGAVIVQSVGRGRAGAEAEITFTNGERYLTWTKSLAVTAERFAVDRTPVFAAIKRSASGNEYLAGLNEAGKPSDEPNCYRHHWVWATPMIMKCRRCGFLKRSER